MPFLDANNVKWLPFTWSQEMDQTGNNCDPVRFPTHEGDAWCLGKKWECEVWSWPGVQGPAWLLTSRVTLDLFFYIQTITRAGEMAFAQTWQPEFDSWVPWSGRKELVPENCPMHHGTQIHIFIFCQFCFCRDPWLVQPTCLRHRFHFHPSSKDSLATVTVIPHSDTTGFLPSSLLTFPSPGPPPQVSAWPATPCHSTVKLTTLDHHNNVITDMPSHPKAHPPKYHPQTRQWQYFDAYDVRSAHLYTGLFLEGMFGLLYWLSISPSVLIIFLVCNLSSRFEGSLSERVY